MFVVLQSALVVVALAAETPLAAAATGWTVADVRVAVGTWGGEHASLTVSEDGARLELDCASGDIHTPVVVDVAGALAIDGDYLRKRSGPARVGTRPEAQPARYTGQLRDTTLTLTITPTGSKEAIGPFTLVLGQEARLRPCR